LQAALKAACPDGVDAYFDNTGGTITDAIWDLLNKFGRVAICGQISIYNNPNVVGPHFLAKTIYKCITIRGFAVMEYPEQIAPFNRDIREWLASGAVKGRETIVKGFEQIPEAFIGLFTGINTGKLLVEI